MSQITPTFVLHDAIEAITSFYNLLCRLYGDEVTLDYPPEGGWPQMAPELQTETGLSDNAFALVRHIPYFRDDPPCLMQGTRPHHYPRFCQDLAGRTESQRKKDKKAEKRVARQVEEAVARDGPSQAALPPHMVILAEGGRYSYTLVIDTERGTVIWWIQMLEWAEGAPKGDVEPIHADLEESWQGMPTFRIKTFFDMCKQQYLTMVRWTLSSFFSFTALFQ